MNRYRVDMGIEGESQPGSKGRVLKNFLNITTTRNMMDAEFFYLLKAQNHYLNILTPTTTFSAKLLCQMHLDWLGHIYPWAGKYRTVEVEKAGFRWPPAINIAQNMKTFETTLLKVLTPCLSEPLPQTSAKIAQIHADFLLIHPFREGNGRLARWLTDLLFIQAGFPQPYYYFSGKGSQQVKAQYLVAVQQGYLGNYFPLADFFTAAVTLRLE